MNLVDCKRAVVSGSARKDVEALLQKSLGQVNPFDVLIIMNKIMNKIKEMLLKQW